MSNGADNDIKLGGAPSAPAPQSIPPGPELEDTGSRALSEALQSSFAIVKVVMVILVIVFFGSGVFTVPSQERAIILRFGKPVGTGEQQLIGPGLHWSFPAPIDEIVRIPISGNQKVTSTAGWYQISPEEEKAGRQPEGNPSLNPAVDGYTITSDANIIHVRAEARYTITDPIRYALNFVNAAGVVQNALDNAIFYASLQYKVDQALREDLIGFQERILSRLREIAATQNLGISVEGVTATTVAPLSLKGAFAAVSQAALERRATNDAAQAYASRILSTAQGEATAIVNSGKTEAAQLSQEVAADAQYFRDQLPHYQKNPGLFRERLRQEALARILANVQDKFFLTKGEGSSELRIMLNRDPRKPAGTNETQTVK